MTRLELERLLVDIAVFAYIYCQAFELKDNEIRFMPGMLLLRSLRLLTLTKDRRFPPKEVELAFNKFSLS